jgi:predicted nucleic acid-binding protein
MTAIDTNIFIYALDASEGEKHIKAAAFLASLAGKPGAAVTLWQVVGEFLKKLRQWKSTGEITAMEFQDRLGDFRSMFPIVLPTEAILTYSLDLDSRYSLSHWDSMLLGACEAAGVTELHTEDMGSPRMIGAVQLRNPLV